MPQLFGERVIVTEDEEDIIEELEKRGYGEKEGKELLLSPEEALYLIEKRMEFPLKNEKGRKVGKKFLMKYFMEQDPEFSRKYLVYRNMRDRGFCLKTGFKFGSHFRVYSRGDRPGKGHAKWLIHCVPEEFTAELSQISRAVRLAQNVRKKMIYAVVDKEGDITYYKIERITP